MDSELQHYLMQCQNRVNRMLDRMLPTAGTEPFVLHRAMRYSVLNGGKRIRSALIYAIGEALNANETILDKCSAAVELIHAFSLVHDDLPAIDNDAVRRGKPACHTAFGEATAILAGDALLALSFEVLANINSSLITPEINLRMIHLLSHYVGSCGMAGGEALDSAATDQHITLNKLATIYKLKTSYLICASIMLGALAARRAEKTLLDDLEKFGLYLGLAFQIHDDIIGTETDTKTLGKPQGSDTARNKPTYPQLLGMAQAKLKEKECLTLAKDYLSKTRIDAKRLLALSEFVIERKN